MTLETLHPDIVEDLKESERKALEILDPGIGVWGAPVEHTITVVYECSCGYHPTLETPHSHHALYGPVIKQFKSDCRVCKKSSWARHTKHQYVPVEIEILDSRHYQLYAD